MLNRRLNGQSLLAGTLLLMSLTSNAEWATQTLTLTPGWNAIFLEVQPEPNLCASVFAHVPLKSIWAWNKRFTSVQYVRDPSDLVPEEPDWLKYFPEGSRNAFLSNLFRVHASHAYLVEIGGTKSVRLQLRGRVIVRPKKWMSNSFNLAGFHVDPNYEPTFEQFLGPSPSHEGQPIFALESDGTWQRIRSPETRKVTRGEAYWIYCEGQSNYSGPFSVELESGQTLNYGRVMLEQMIRLRNTTAAPKEITLQMLPAQRPKTGPSLASSTDALPPLAGDVVLAYQTLLSWKPLEEALTVTLEPNSVLGLRLTVLRPRMVTPPSEGAVFESVLEVTDNEGGRFRIPVTATKAVSPRGLWVGTATIDRVSEAANPETPDIPTPTASNFEFRIIVHVDDAGDARLLQEVMLMQIQPELIDDPDNPGTLIPAEAPRYVLVTDESLIPEFQGVSLRDGVLVGRRISSPVFSFDAPILLTGDVTTSLEGTITTEYDDPLNPFVHAFHPDHDNLNERFDAQLPEGLESYTFERRVTLEFKPVSPMGLSLPNWGDDLLGGVYHERVSGVHQNDIFVQGRFELRHIIDVPVLNDGR